MTYSPTTGRWMQDDPIGFTAGDLDLYRFVGDDPANRLDPSGRAELPKLNTTIWLDNLPDFAVSYNVQLVESIPKAVGVTTTGESPTINFECKCQDGKWQAFLTKYTSGYTVKLAQVDSSNGKKLTANSIVNVWLHEYKHIQSYKTIDGQLYTEAKFGFPKLGKFGSKKECNDNALELWNKLQKDYLNFKKKEVDHANPGSPDPVKVEYTD